MERRDFLQHLAGVAAGVQAQPTADNPSGATHDLHDPADVARTLRVFVLEHGELWDVKQVVEVLLKSGANTVRCDVGIYRGLVTMFPSKHLPPHPRLGGRDRLREMLDECGKHGIRVFPYNAFYGAMSPEVCELHPDWTIKNLDGTSVPTACQNNPHYVLTYSNVCRELASNYEVIGMYFDGPGEPGVLGKTPEGRVTQQYCFCRHCRLAFRELFQRDMAVDLGRQYEAEFRQQMLVVHMRGVNFFTAAVASAIKSVRNIPVLVNLCDPSIRVVRYPSMNSVDGALVAEIHRGDAFGTSVGMSFMNALLNTKIGAAFGKAGWCYCPIGPHEQHVTYDDLETQIFGMMQLTHGGTPIMQTLEAYLYDQTALPAVRDVFRRMEKYSHLYATFKPVQFLALHCSAQAGFRATALEPRERIGHWQNTNHRGAFAALTNAHQQFEVILDEHLRPETLRAYRALFLPNSACLSDGQIQAIQQYVEAGGGLIATGLTSLFHEGGSRRDDFGLKDVFHVSYGGQHSLMEGRLGNGDPYVHVASRHASLGGIRADQLIPCQHEPFPLVSLLSGGELIADMYLGNTGEDFGPIVFPEDSPAAIVASMYGKGRVVYIAPNIDLLYYARGFRLVRTFLANAVDWVTRGERPMRINAPMCVVVNLVEKGSRRALHLINYTGDMRENRAYKVEWVAPLSGLSVGVRPRAGSRLVRANILGSRAALTSTQKDGLDWVALPRLSVYECVEFEYHEAV